MRVAHFRIEVQHDADDLVCDVVGDLLPKEDDALAVQPVVEVHLRACGVSLTGTNGRAGVRAWQDRAPSRHCRHREIGKAPARSTTKSITALAAGGRCLVHWCTLGTPIGIMVTAELRAPVR